jgi:hypothetical protein
LDGLAKMSSQDWLSIIFFVVAVFGMMLLLMEGDL